MDTAGWMACADSADPAHGRSCDARDAALEAGQSLVTTDFVIDEERATWRASSDDGRLRRRPNPSSHPRWLERGQQATALRVEAAPASPAGARSWQSADPETGNQPSLKLAISRRPH